MASTFNSIVTTFFVLSISLLCLREIEYYHQRASVPPRVTIYVAGAVKRPGTVSLPTGARRIHALAAAGGLLPGSDPSQLEPAKPLVDGETLFVSKQAHQPAGALAVSKPSGGAAARAPVQSAYAAPQSSRPTLPERGQPRLGLNTATAEQLQQLPGIGPVLAGRIVAAREARPSGTFATIEDLSTIRGIKRKTMARLAPYLELEAYDR